jgi:hypothetical protein
MDGPADTLRNSDSLGVCHRTVPELMVRIDRQPRPPIWQRFSLDLDPDLKRWSRTVANIMYGDFVQGFSKAKAETLRPHRSIAIGFELEYDLPEWWISQCIRLKWYSGDCVGLSPVLTRPDYGFRLKHPIPYGRINELVFSYD